MKKPTHNFNLETKANKNGERLIYFNLNYGFKGTTSKNILRYMPMRVSTQWTIKEEFWVGSPIYRANTTYVRRFGRGLNNILDEIERKAYEQLSNYREQNESNPEPSELKRLILEKLKRVKKSDGNTSLIDFIYKEINRRTSLPESSSEYWKSTTAQLYQTLINHIDKYEEKTNRILVLEDMTEEIYWEYFRVINQIKKDDTGVGYTQTSMHKDYKHLKVIFTSADEQGIDIGFNYRKRGLRISPAKSSSETYLTEEQLTKIIDTDVSHSIALTHAKNYIIISSFTGLRIADMKMIHELSPENISHNNETVFTLTTRIRKSRDNREELIAILPILNPVRKLLDEQNGKFPTFPAESKINKNIKKLLKFLGFNNPVEFSYKYYLEPEPVIETKSQHEVFTAHDCRRTFITLLKELGISNEVIEPITHPKLKYASIIDLYDKSPLISKAQRLIQELEGKDSIYSYS